MRAKALMAVLLIAFLLQFFAPVAMAQESQPLITAIEIRGLKRIEEGSVKKHITSQVGAPLSPEKVTQDIKNIYQTGYFDDVKVDAEPFEGGLKLIYIVKEKPSILRFNFSGNKGIEASKLKEQVTISAGSIADPVLINDNAIKLRDYYEKEGYGLAEVIPVLKYERQGVLLTYLIKEGPKVKIKKVIIRGNKAISSGELKKAMKSTTWGLVSFITKKGYFKRADVMADSDRIKEVYFNHGYIQAAVSEPVIRFSKDRKWATLVYHVSEGGRFRVSKIEFSGNKVFATDELRKLLETRTGQPVSRAKIRDDVVAMTEKYSERGYAVVSVNPDVVPDLEKKTAEVFYQIEEGDIYHIGRIDISGNIKTRDYVIRREILLNEGDTFNSRLLKRSYERINNLNFFDNVQMQPEPVPEKKKVNIDVKVRERPTGFLSVGGGYSSVDHLIGMVDLTQGNLGGRGQYVKASAQLGGRSSTYEITFRDPYVLGTNYSMSTSVYRTSRDYLDYSRNATGGEIGLGRNLNDYWNANVLYRLENATIYGIQNGASPLVLDQAGTRLTSSISPGIVRDSRDNFLDPHTGSRNSAYLTFAGIGGDNKYLKFEVDSSWYLPVTKTTTLALRGRYGYSTGVFGQPVPLYERFYVGGIYTVRGLGYGEGGPKDVNGQPIGGKQQIIFNTDYIFPLITDLKLKGVVFFDTGTAYDTAPDFRYTSGVGIRWISPMGPIRLEWGYNLDKRPGEKSSRFEFAFGTFF